MEKVDHPKHYNVGKFEVIDVIEDWKLNFNLGNAIKYIARADHKENKVQDLEKAIWYIKREIDRKVKVEKTENLFTVSNDLIEMYERGEK